MSTTPLQPSRRLSDERIDELAKMARNASRSFVRDLLLRAADEESALHSGKGHVHRCMSCGKSWRCPNQMICRAQADVMPVVVLDGPDGPQTFDHICQRKK